MRITILALGSRGDVQPVIWLGRGLRQAGHQVCLATFESFSGMVTRAGLEFLPIPGDAQALLNQAGGDRSGLSQSTNPLSAFQALRRSYGSLAKNIPLSLTALAQRPCDMVLNQLPGNLFGPDLAEYLKIPLAVLSVIPLVPTRVRPLFGFPAWPGFLPGYNRLTYRLGLQMAWQMFRPVANRWRIRDLGLPPRSFLESERSLVRTAGQEPYPVICGFSPLVVPPSPDWGSNVTLTGWWQDNDPVRQPSSELLRFLDAGRAPVFVGFGSMPIQDPASSTALVVDAVRASGCRAILHSGWAGLGGRLPPEVFPIEYAPYEWLFPRMAGVIHHGGSGTTGYALHAGVPSAVVPFMFDQYFWGERGAALGVGPASLPFRRLTVTRLAEMIADLVTETSYLYRAVSLAETLRKETGIQTAVQAIEALG